MLRLALTASALAVAATATDVPASANLFKFHAKPRLSWEQAERACSEAGANLAWISSVEENAHLWDTAQSLGIDKFWIGGHRKGGAAGEGPSDSAWSWGVDDVTFGAPDLPDFDEDGTHDLWGKKEPNNFKGKEKCARVGDDGKWNDGQCFQTFPYVCRYAATTTTGPATTTTTAAPTTTTTGAPTTTTTAAPTTTTTEAPTTTTTEAPTTTTAEPTTKYHPPWDYNADTLCWYKKFDTEMTWGDASAFCSNDADIESTWLASPSSLAEAEYIASMRDAGKPIWTGGHRAGGSTDWEWWATDLDFEVSTWDGWYAGEPNRGVEEESCLFQGVSRRKADKMMWKMNDAACSSKARFVCQYCHATTSTTAAPSTTTTVAPTTTTTEKPTTTTTEKPTTTTTEKPTTTTTEAPTTTTLGPTTMPLPENGWEQAPDSQCYYWASSEKKKYDGAVAACADAYSAGGEDSHLVTISTDAEARFVSTLNGRDRGTPLWVGVRQTTNGDWYNIDGTFFSQTLSLFYDGEPNGNTGYAQMGFAKKGADTHPEKLNDVPPSNKNRYVCEWCNPLFASTTTEVPATTTTTAVPTTTTTEMSETTTSTGEAPETPCSANLVANEITDPAKLTLIEHIGYVAALNKAMDNKKSGRTLAVKPTCETYCTGLAWGAACAPCALKDLTTESACMFPGPFLTGELCHRNATSGEITSLPCCNFPDAQKVDGYDIARATTCVKGKQCNCKRYSPTKSLDKKDFADQKRALEKFPAATIYTMPRKFTVEGGCEAL